MAARASTTSRGATRWSNWDLTNSGDGELAEGDQLSFGVHSPANVTGLIMMVNGNEWN